MKGFELELTLSGRNANHAETVLDRGNKEVLRISAPGLELEASRTPEIQQFNVSSAVLWICGHIVFEGEVCDRAEIAELFIAQWRKDTVGTINRLDGSFLLIIYETDSGQTSIVSDPFGSRPFWFAETQDGIEFGTIPGQVALRAGRAIEPDPAWMWSMLHFRRNVGGRSPVKGVQGLPSGSIMAYKGGQAKIGTWYDYTFAPAYEKSRNHFGATFLELVEKQISRTCKQHEKTALLLSGGLDSRLLAACCPNTVHCITLCDSRNREVELAGRVAETLNLNHEVIVRPEYWYPGLLEDSCRIGGGVWLWDQAHFLPLGDQEYEYGATLVGYGSDSFFKGKDLEHPELWRMQGEPDELIAQALALLEAQPPKVKTALEMLDPDFAEECRKAFFEECREVLESEMAYCTTLPDLWQQFWGRNLSRATALMNLISLRGFTRERNVFTTVAMRRFHQTVPAELRRAGRLPIMALEAGGYRNMLTIPDANTWLPYTLPGFVHKASSQARRTIAHTRKRMRARQKNADFKSKSSWPHNGRLWLSSKQMSSLMDGFVGGGVYDRTLFDNAKIQGIWNEHIQGTNDHSAALDFMVTYGCVFREPSKGRNDGMLS